MFQRTFETRYRESKTPQEIDRGPLGFKEASTLNNARGVLGVQRKRAFQPPLALFLGMSDVVNRCKAKIDKAIKLALEQWIKRSPARFRIFPS